MQISRFFLVPAAIAALFSPCLDVAAAPVVSEVMSNNDATLQDEDGDYSDWVELHNPDDQPFDLEGHFLSDDPNDLERWEIPAVTLAPDAYLVIFASGKNRTDPESELHTGFKLSSGGEDLFLVAPDGEARLSALVVPPLEGGTSYISVGNGGQYGYQITDQPTPGAENSDNVVQFSVTGRAFTGTLTVELSTPSGEQIRFSRDGRAPTLFNGAVYSDPIEIDSTTIITAVTSGGPMRSETFIKVSDALMNRDSDLPLMIVDTFGDAVAPKESDMTTMAVGLQDPVAEEGRARLVGGFETSSRGGIRRRGQSSGGFPKMPMRMEFWNEQQDAEDRNEGKDRTLAPLGLPANSDWILNARYQFDRALMRNAWIYEMSNMIGRYAARTRFVELYLNTDGGEVDEGDYFGVYTFMETIKRDGDRVDVPAMEVTDTEAPEITGGYIFKKDKNDSGIWQFTGGGVPLQMVYPTEEEREDRAHNQAYLSGFLNEMNGRLDNPDPETGYPAYLDVMSWVDHHLLNVLTLNVDALRISGYFYKERDTAEAFGKVFAGPVWDFDRSAESTDGRDDNPRAWRGSGGDNGTHFFRSALGEPRWWQDLFEERDFQQAWADRWHALRREVMVSGDRHAEALPAFSVGNIHRIIDRMAAELDESQVRNFDRWSSARPRGSYENEIRILKDWLETRVDWIDSELVTVPSFTPDGGSDENEIAVTMKAGGTLFNPARIYYTTDGSDPRVPGGEPRGSALLYEDPVNLTASTTVVARKRDTNYSSSVNGPDQEWSAPARTRFYIGSEPAGAENLIVSEIMYNPPGPSDEETEAGFGVDDLFEFIELRNISESPIDLTGVTVRGESDFDFPEGFVLGSGEHVVLARDRAAFAARYGSAIPTYGPVDGSLSNRGGRIALRDFHGALIREFEYDDGNGWPETADGDGFSLELRNQGDNPDPAVAANWMASAEENGTPGTGPDLGPGGGDSGFAAWQEGQFDAAQLADESISGSLADPDHDGLVNLGEYGLGGTALVSDAAGLLPVVTVEEGRLVFSYARPVGLEGIAYEVEVSLDLGTWQSQSDRGMSMEITDNGDGTESVLVRDAVSDDRTLFARLRFRQTD